MTKEWAQTADDVLWRRSKLGLRLTDAQRAMLDRFMAQTTSEIAHFVRAVNAMHTTSAASRRSSRHGRSERDRRTLY